VERSGWSVAGRGLAGLPDKYPDAVFSQVV